MSVHTSIINLSNLFFKNANVSSECTAGEPIIYSVIIERTLTTIRDVR